MGKPSHRKSIAAIAICLVIVLICGFVMSNVKTSGGKNEVKEVVISPYGSDLAMSLYIPKEALKTDEKGNFLHPGGYPAVIVNSGYTDERSCLENVANELSARGFVVASFDMYGHGHSDTISNRGYGTVPDVFGDDMALMGAYDVLDYLRSLGYVDQTRIGMIGHSLGGAATGGMAMTSAGFYTLQDLYLNLLHDEFGLNVSPEQVAAQDADAVAAGKLDQEQNFRYEQRKAEIAEEFSRGLRSMMVLDAGVGFANPKEVEVAGNPVWRDVQANFALTSNVSGGGSKGIKDPNYGQTTKATLTFLSQDQPVQKDTWYKVNLSATNERELSTKIGSFYTSPSDATIQDLVATHSLRIFAQPRGWHAYTCMSGETATAAVQFFTTALQWDNGDLAHGANTASASSSNTSRWKIKEIASAIALLAMIAAVLPLVGLLLDTAPFESLNGTPAEAINTKVTPVLLITAAITIFVPMFTYSKGVGWGAKIPGSAISTIQVATQTAVWSVVMTLMILAVILLKYFLYDKKRTEQSFTEMYGLKLQGKNILKAIGIALIVFAFIAIILTAFYSLFHGAKMKITPLGKILYASLTVPQYYSYFLYALWFFPFYLINSMMVNSFRFKNMSERANMFAVAGINCSGMLILTLCQIVFGLWLRGATIFKTIPGSSATIMNLPFFAVMLFFSAIFTRKLYMKTGSSIPGALLNTAIFTFPALQSFSYFSLL